ncbi:MAG: thiamine pyrophosphate-dependent enzyme, partial [Firmicutes bacterium]|nr:thiamine pyrophosphate-dependent enzyme [Bacillota bacterium]
MAVVRKEESALLKGKPTQKQDFKSGNEMAAVAIAQINPHVMGYYPITPSTEIAEFLDEMKAEGEHSITMIPADGEHGAAGICFGASTGGGRVVNATSANGLLYSLEQLPVQSGSRLPMVLNLVCRAVSGPLDIRGDHSDLYFAIHAGWPIIMARNPQMVYDFNVIAPRLAEHPDVRLPVIVAYDGFFTSHQKRRVSYFNDKQTVQEFVGPYLETVTTLDPRHPVTVGPYMNDPDLINNKYQLHLAMEAAGRVAQSVFAEYARVSGRSYGLVDAYRTEDADAVVFLLGSAADTAKDVADKMRAQGHKVGVLALNVIRPFPAEEIRKALKNARAVLVGERADSYGSAGGMISQEIKSVLMDGGLTNVKVLTRIYGLGGKDFYPEDAEVFFRLALETAETGKVAVPFDYYGTTATTGNKPTVVVPPLSYEETHTGLVKVNRDEATGELKVVLPPPRALTGKAKKIAPGHGACPGCGIFGALDQFFRGLEGDIVVLYHTGCAMVVTTGYPFSSHRVTYIHNLFQNGAATLSGAVEMYYEKVRRGEITAPAGDELTFVMVTGDGGMDIGMGPAIGTALRNHKMIIVEYDNEGYMNTGAQLSYSTPMGHMTSTSHPGATSFGKTFHHKDTPQIMAATNIPYVFTGTEAFPQDLMKKAAKAQWYAKNVGLAYGKLLITCPLNWK